ncbi:MAG: FliM/FliN family flagellar motor switch protein [Burkholderiales bacterium]|nr:FliM/FliN family flagellar motor switch protein [Burkholderiales bacterium]
MSKPTDTNPSAPQIIELTDLGQHTGHGPNILSGNLDALQNVKVRLSVRVGEATLSIGELTRMREEHVIKLESLADAPVDILLEGHVVARGQLVAVDDHFGVRLTELPKATA